MDTKIKVFQSDGRGEFTRDITQITLMSDLYSLK